MLSGLLITTMFVPLPKTLLAGCCLAMILGGCGLRDSRFYRQEEILKKFNELSSLYLTSDAAQAEECLRKQAALLESSAILEPSGRAELLAMTYFRLYVLQDRLGSSEAAEAALIKARYWLLRRSELGGEPVTIALTKIRGLTQDTIRQEVDRLDRKHNRGNPAQYIRVTK